MADEDSLAKLNQARNADRAETAKAQATDHSETDITAAEFLLIGGLAVIKDALDVIVTASIIGVILTSIINFPITLMLWLWCVLRLKRFPTARFLGTASLEFIPFLGALPLWTGFVISLWLEQTGYMPKWLTKITGAKRASTV